MAKKSPQWVTIPEASLHTPASGSGKATAPKAESPDKVKNKLFWGVGFAVLIVASFAVMAPNQFGQLLIGSLFDTAGVEGQPSGIISPLNLLPSETREEEEPAPSEDSPVMEDQASVPAVEEEVPQSEPVVKPQEQPTTISVEPISTPEEITIEPVATGPVECGTNVDCLLGHLTDCSLAKGVFAYSIMGQGVEANLEITGSESENCIVSAALTKAPQADLVGKGAVCKLPKGEYTEQSLQSEFSDLERLSEACSGSAVDALKDYLGLMSVANSQAELVQKLMQQVQQLQEEQLQNQGETRPSAPEQTIPTQTASNALQPGFRANPYRVTISPEQMLRQNAAGSVPQYSNASIGSYQPAPATQQPVYQPYQPVTGTKTPQTGPEETALALLVAFMALVSWKFVRTFAK